MLQCLLTASSSIIDSISKLLDLTTYYGLHKLFGGGYFMRAVTATFEGCLLSKGGCFRLLNTCMHDKFHCHHAKVAI